uniref:30S ribosomal protein S3 n=1 Tax=Kappaphycus malesianus TaxID=1408293 RepID=UPI00223880B3|nr:30S ribosomal protein S3 [Kappaphycus malesianus]UYR20488.1 30S ribosomal protein S3 [Kappaphycus malesianus]
MAQKINPISFRLGITRIWNSNLQIYGKSCFIYSFLFFRYLKAIKLIKRILNSNGFSIDYQNWKVGKLKVKLSIYYSNLTSTGVKANLSVFKTIFRILNIWFPKKVSMILYFNRSGGSLFGNFIVKYVQHLININAPSKKIIWNVSKLIKVFLYEEKIIFYKNGILKIKLRGFKVFLSGRLEDSKTQMAKSFQHSKGSLPLNMLKNHIIYDSGIVYTKNGTCGLKIWLFYEFY